MAKDYGNRPGRKGGSGLVLWGVLGLIAVIGVGGFGVFEFQRRQVQERTLIAYWTPNGAPCAPMTAAQAAALPRKLDKVVDLGAASVGRAYADGVCREFEGGLAKAVGGPFGCQFSGPGWLEVKTAAGAAYFDAGDGPATVVFGDAPPRCIKAGNLQRAAMEP